MEIPSQASIAPSRLARSLPAIASALLALALYAVCIGGTYIYDDVAVVRPEHDDRLADPTQWKRYWTESYNQGVDNLYRPLVSMSYALQWKIHGDRPWVFHLINVLLHAGVSACVADFARRMIGMRAAYMAGLLFAAHPIHVEDVANIVGRAELMSALGVFGALILFLRPITPRRAVAIVGCFVLSLLSKEQGMLLPLLLLILWFLQRRFQPREPDTKQGMQVLILALCWGLAGYIVWRETHLKFWWDRNFIDWTINPMIPTPDHPYRAVVAANRWLMPLVLLGRYTALLIFPWKLSPDYGAGVVGWEVRLNDPYFYMGLLAILAWIVVLSISLIKRSAACVFTALALAITYGMVGNVVALIGTNFAERLMYLPSAFFVILIAAAAASVLPRVALVVFTTVVVLTASVRTITYAARWNNDLEFYRISSQEQPKSIRLYMLQASAYQSRGQLEQAERVLAQARSVLPNYWEIWFQSALIAMDQGKFSEAQQDIDRAMQIRPSPKGQFFMNELEKRRQRAATQPASAPTQ
jgi:hypothetical protein